MGTHYCIGGGEVPGSSNGKRGDEGVRVNDDKRGEFGEEGGTDGKGVRCFR
jgi:hypothetical protein